MKNIQTKTKSFTIENLTFSEVEAYLKLPSGISYSEAKKQAITISTEHSISLEDALKYILWSNGYPKINKVSDAEQEIVKFNFDKSLDDFGILLESGEPTGYCYFNKESESWSLITYPMKNKNLLTKTLVKNMQSNVECKVKESMFLKAVKNCVNEIGHDFYRLPDGKSLDDVTNLLEIDIDIDKLLGGGHGTNSTLRYALASCYNPLDTAKYIMNNTLLKKYDYDGIKTLRIDDESDRNTVYEYMNKYQSFGAMCINLDAKSKIVVSDLINNYCGW